MKIGFEEQANTKANIIMWISDFPQIESKWWMSGLVTSNAEQNTKDESCRWCIFITNQQMLIAEKFPITRWCCRWCQRRTLGATWVAAPTSTATTSTLQTPSDGDAKRELRLSRPSGLPSSALSTRIRSRPARRSSLCRTAWTWRRRWSGCGFAIGENFPAIRG